MLISITFEVNMTIRFCCLPYNHSPLTCWPWTVVIHGGSRCQFLHQVWRSCSPGRLWAAVSMVCLI